MNFFLGQYYRHVARVYLNTMKGESYTYVCGQYFITTQNFTQID